MTEGGEYDTYRDGVMCTRRDTESVQFELVGAQCEK